MKIWKLSAVLSILLLLPCATFGQIYEWMDESGVKHYSNDPPPDGVKAFTQADEIKTDEAQLQKQEESGRQDLEEPEEQTPESEAEPEQAASETDGEAGPGTVVVEDDDNEAFHRDRIKRRTRQNTSPAPSLENRPRSEVPQSQPAEPTGTGGEARQNPRVEQKRNQP